MTGPLVDFLANIFDSNIIFSHFVCDMTRAST